MVNFVCYNCLQVSLVIFKYDLSFCKSYLEHIKKILFFLGLLHGTFWNPKPFVPVSI